MKRIRVASQNGVLDERPDAFAFGPLLLELEDAGGCHCGLRQKGAKTLWTQRMVEM